MGPTLQVTGHSAVREDASGPKSRPPRPRQLAFRSELGAKAGAGPLPAGLKPYAPGHLHLGHGGKRAIEGLAEVGSLSLGDAVATILLHVEYACISAGYIQICGMKRKG